MEKLPKEAALVGTAFALVISGGLFTGTFLNMIVVPALCARFGRRLEPSFITT
jgi:Cu/Ag efflux pump CusA